MIMTKPLSVQDFQKKRTGFDAVKLPKPPLFIMLDNLKHKVQAKFIQVMQSQRLVRVDDTKNSCKGRNSDLKTTLLK